MLKPVENLRIALRDLIVDMYDSLLGVECVMDVNDFEVAEQVATAFNTLDVSAQAFFGLSASELFDLYDNCDCDIEDTTDEKKTES